MRIILEEACVEYRVASERKIQRPEDAARAVGQVAGDTQEHAVVLILNAQNGLIAAEVVGSGLVNQCEVHPREIFRPAILRNAVAVVFVHNHPAGGPPTSEDIRVTRKLIEAGKVLEIDLLDSVVVSMGADGLKWVSMREDGLVAF